MKFSFGTINEKDRGNRPTPSQLLQIVHNSVADPMEEIYQASIGELRLEVDYGRHEAPGEETADKLGSTKSGVKKGVIYFLITVYWPASMPLHNALASLLHEILIHVAPKWAAFKMGTTPSDDVRANEKAEHNTPKLWAAAVTAARTVDKGVVQETVKDAFYKLHKADETGVLLEEFKVLAKIPANVFDACLDGTFAGSPAKTEAATSDDSSDDVAKSTNQDVTDTSAVTDGKAETKG